MTDAARAEALKLKTADAKKAGSNERSTAYSKQCRQHRRPPPANKIPLVVDLDGTLIKTDLLCGNRSRGAPGENQFQILPILFWGSRPVIFERNNSSARQKWTASLPCPIIQNSRFVSEQTSTGRKNSSRTHRFTDALCPRESRQTVRHEVLGAVS